MGAGKLEAPGALLGKQNERENAGPRRQAWPRLVESRSDSRFNRPRVIDSEPHFSLQILVDPEAGEDGMIGQVS